MNGLYTCAKCKNDALSVDSNLRCDKCKSKLCGRCLVKKNFYNKKWGGLERIETYCPICKELMFIWTSKMQLCEFKEDKEECERPSSYACAWCGIHTCANHSRIKHNLQFRDFVVCNKCLDEINKGAVIAENIAKDKLFV